MSIKDVVPENISVANKIWKVSSRLLAPEKQERLMTVSVLTRRQSGSSSHCRGWGGGGKTSNQRLLYKELDISS